MELTGSFQIAGETPSHGAIFHRMAMPKRLLVPLIGIEAAAVEAQPAGMFVRRGDELLKSCPPDAPVPLAPADGEISGVGRATLLDGREVPAIVLEVTANSDTSSTHSEPPVDVLLALKLIEASMLGEWMGRFRDAGLHADRWGSPDLLAQLADCHARPADVLICNALELDPAVPLQSMLMRERGMECVAGVALLARLTGISAVWIVADPEVVREMPAPLLAEAAALGVRMVPVENEYPRANPTILLEALTRRRLPFGERPTARGVLLFDAAAAISAGRCLLHGEKGLTVPIGLHAGPGELKLWDCPVGMSLRDVMSGAGLAIEHAVYRTGSRLREVRVKSDAVVGGSELTVFVDTAEKEEPPPDPCIRWAWCVEGCPVRIQPAALLEAAQRNDHAMAERYGLHACIECGICSYVCPSVLPLLQGIRILRSRAQRRG